MTRRYAKKHSLPLPDTTSAAGSKDTGGAKKTCIDVCAEFGGVQDCQTRCAASHGHAGLHGCVRIALRRTKPLVGGCGTGRCVRIESEKKHACREACQVAFSSACDRAFPPTSENGPHNYKVCRFVGLQCPLSAKSSFLRQTDASSGVPCADVSAVPGGVVQGHLPGVLGVKSV